MSADRDFGVRFHLAELEQIDICYVNYESGVSMKAQTVDDFFLVQCPLSGHATTNSGLRTVSNGRYMGTLLSPGDSPSMVWERGTPHLLLRIDRVALEASLAQQLGDVPVRELRFDMLMELRSASVSHFKSVLDLLVREVDALPAPGGELPAYRQLRALLFSRLLLSQPNTYSAALRSTPRELPPRVVRDAMAAMEDRVGEFDTIDEIAARCGVGTRALQASFRRYLGTTPTAYLRQLRLRKAAAELAASSPGQVAVSDVALRWGFLHLGRFSEYYKAEYGEMPSETLRRGGS